MSLTENTLDELVEEVCKNYLDDWWGGTSTGGDANSLADTINRFEADDYFNSMPYSEIYIRTGPSAGDARVITDYANATGQIDVGVNFTATITSDVRYSVHSKFKRAQVVNAVNMALSIVAEEAAQWKRDDTSVVLQDAVYEYNFPSGFTYIYDLTMADSSGNFKDPPIPHSQWQLFHAGTRLAFPRDSRNDNDFEAEGWWYNTEDFIPVEDRALRIEGLAAPIKLVTDSDICWVNPAYICPQTAAILLRSRASINDPHGYGARADVLQKQADRERVLIVPMSLPLGARRVNENG